ncbi:hypothetical protein [Spirosoma validum]|uniref:Uncharacterized protein n=1 Tax=Spirosoma validum TaxID=2771355 RepID=A0A927B7Y5_9BACT|nr:hypothetical protein [Spirosoma validum]MBD2757019.1 hypothetical protein [Spirosoma validum]
MKILTALMALLFSTIAIAQQTEKPAYKQLSKSIDNDGKTLAIEINGEQVNGQKLRYKHTFNVADLSAEQRQSLTNRVLDSLGVNEVPQSPKSPQAGTETVTFDCKTCTGKSRLEIYGNGFTSTRQFDSNKDREPAFPFTLNLNPGTYQYTYWQNKVQQMKLPFTVKAGETNVVTVK